MSAQRSRVPDPEDAIRKAFREAGYADGWTDAVLADFAHELAEKQRAVVKHHEGLGFLSDLTPSKLIAVIDPEVSDSV